MLTHFHNIFTRVRNIFTHVHNMFTYSHNMFIIFHDIVTHIRIIFGACFGHFRVFPESSEVFGSVPDVSRGVSHSRAILIEFVVPPCFFNLPLV